MIRRQTRKTRRKPHRRTETSDRELWFWSMDIANRQRDSIDRALLTIATGAVGVSLILSSDLAHFSLRWFLVSGSILSELIAIFMVIASHRRSAIGYEKYAETQSSDPINNKKIERRNQWAMAFVVIGVTAAFAAFSLPNEEETQNGQERTGQAATETATEARPIEATGWRGTKATAS